MHLSDTRLHQFIDDAMPGDERLQIQRHLAECASCRDRVDEARHDDRLVFSALARLDQPLPTVHIAEIRKRAQRRTLWLRYAAGLVLLAGLAGATYALPHSPLRSWIASLGNDGGARHANSPPQATPARDTLMAGVAFTPGMQYRIEFGAAQTAGVARVRVVEAVQLTVRATDDRVGFNVGNQQLTISNAGSRGDYEILLPADLPSASIRVAGRTVWSKSGSAIWPADTDSGGQYLIPLR